jgi:hypothetical protein
LKWPSWCSVREISSLFLSVNSPTAVPRSP